ncbi:hypothetical protein XOCgx_0794 [Xanthomonas oryzae pv. oryzicola]|nr:hypothetical protein XOCgx_0794 [Xanthomonas oryzae pv. oryzicola]
MKRCASLSPSAWQPAASRDWSQAFSSCCEPVSEMVFVNEWICCKVCA